MVLILRLLTFGVGAGAFAGDKKNNAGGGMGGKMSPSAVLVIQNGATKLVNIKNQDTVTKILDMVPDVVDRITGKFGDGRGYVLRRLLRRAPWTYVICWR